MWYLTSVDIEATLRKVIVKVTHDNYITPQQRDKRKQALVKLGKIYTRRGAEHMGQGGIEEILNQVCWRLKNIVQFFLNTLNGDSVNSFSDDYVNSATAATCISTRRRSQMSFRQLRIMSTMM